MTQTIILLENSIYYMELLYNRLALEINWLTISQKAHIVDLNLCKDIQATACLLSRLLTKTSYALAKKSGDLKIATDYLTILIEKITDLIKLADFEFPLNNILVSFSKDQLN